MRLKDQKDTSQRELTKGKKTMVRAPMVPPKSNAKELKMKFQQSPVRLPRAKRRNFLWCVPFSWKVIEMKRKLKIRSVAVDWLALGWEGNRQYEAIRHSIIATAESATINLPIIFTI